MISKSDVANRLVLGGGLLLNALQEASDKQLGVNSQLSVTLRAALSGDGKLRMAEVQRELSSLSETIQEDLLREAHRTMTLSGMGLFSSLPVRNQGSRGKPSKH